MVSPRQRARRTFELLFASLDQRPDIQIDERVREWTYGAYEGRHSIYVMSKYLILTHVCAGKYKREVVAMRKEKDLPSGESGWDIWHDGCEEGETAAQMTARVDDVVNAVRSAHKVWHETSQPDEQGGDILIISHGQSLFAVFAETRHHSDTQVTFHVASWLAG
jgi:broad specificity phosphatase PhoE